MEKNAFGFLACVPYKKHLFASGWEISGLFRIDLESYEMEYLGKFPDDSKHQLAIRVEDELWFIPTATIIPSTIDIWKPEMNEFDKISLRTDLRIYHRAFSKVYSYADSVYVFPCAYKYIIEIEKATHNVKYHSLEPYIEYNGYKENFMTITQFEDKFYMCPFEAECMLIFDPQTGNIESYEWGGEKSIYVSSRVYNKELYFFPRDIRRPILKWNQMERKVEEYCILDLKGNMSDKYNDVYIVKEKAYFAPAIKSDLLIWDMKLNITEKISLDKLIKAGNYYEFIEADEKIVTSLPLHGTPLLLINKKTAEVEFHDIYSKISRLEYFIEDVLSME